MKKYRVIFRDLMGMSYHVLIETSDIEESVDKMLKSTKMLIDEKKNRYLVTDKVVNVEWKEEV